MRNVDCKKQNGLCLCKKHLIDKSENTRQICFFSLKYYLLFKKKVAFKKKKKKRLVLNNSVYMYVGYKFCSLLTSNLGMAKLIQPTGT